jgi:hypothetical protein
MDLGSSFGTYTKKEEPVKLVIVLLTVLMLLIAVRTRDHVAEAWECRCDTCCIFLEEVWR